MSRISDDASISCCFCRGATVGEALEALVQLPGLRTIGVTEPSVSCGSRNIFLRQAGMIIACGVGRVSAR